MNEPIYLLTFIICVFISSCIQIVLKKAALKERKGLKVFANLEVIVCYIVFLGVTFCTTYLYKHVELSVGTLLDSLGYVFIIILSVVFLKEKMTINKFIGVSLVILGVFICINL